MTDTTLTFSTFTNQAPVELLTDPTKPGWEDLLSAEAKHQDEDDEDKKVSVT